MTKKSQKNSDERPLKVCLVVATQFRKKRVDQHHIARRRALAKDTKTMAAIAAGLVTEWNRKDKSCFTQTKGKPLCNLVQVC